MKAQPLIDRLLRRVEFDTNGIADGLHVGKRQAGRIFRHEVHRLQPGADFRYQRKQIFTGKAGRAGTIGTAPTGDGAAGGDDRHQRYRALPAQCDAPARSAARR